MSVMLLGTSICAQSPLVQTKGNFRPCIGQLTTSGKAVLISEEKIGSEDNEAYTYSIYDDQLNIINTINVTPKVLTYHTWMESATVVPTGFSYAFYDADYKYENGEKVFYEGYDNIPEEFGLGWLMDFSDVTSPEQLVQKLVDAEQIPAGECYPFTDFKGNMAFVSLYNTDVKHCFYFYETFGAKYPIVSFWTLIDGKLCLVRDPLWNSYGEILYSTDNVVWNVDESTKVEYNRGCHIEGVEYADYDNGTEWEVTLTQSLFNNDDKWEYCVHEHKVISIPEEEKRVFESRVNEDGTLTLFRNGGETTEFDRIVVYNEDGVECLSFGAAVDFDDVYRLNGKDYICGELKDANGEWYDCLWELVKDANSIREVARAKSSKVKAEKNAVIVEVDEELSGSDVMISDVAGQLVGRGRIEKGNKSARVAMPTHTPGVYVVSLKRGNNVVESHKMMIK